MRTTVLARLGLLLLLSASSTGCALGVETRPANVATNSVDRSRAPELIGSFDWTSDCRFPREADSEQINHAVVLIEVNVKADGSPERVTVLEDPGHGFGREARECAMRRLYTQGLDADGNPTARAKPFRVAFIR